MTAIPMLNLTRQFSGIKREVMEEIERVFDSQKFILGDNVHAFEQELARYLGSGYAVGVSSGTDALLVSLMALGVGPGDEVIVPAFTFFATAGTVARLGAVPVFADIEPDTFNISVTSVREKVTSKTRAIIPVHLYGQCADMDALSDVAREYHLVIVEDACQAIGARFGGRAAGTMGELGAFSFFPTKNLGAAGDAGLVTAQDDHLAKRLSDLRVHGMRPRYYHSEIGGNFRLDDVQAAVLRVKLRHLDEWNKKRRAIADRYRELLSDTEKRGRIALPREKEGRFHVYHQFVVRVQNRDAVREKMSKEGIGTEIYYPVPLHLQECFAALGVRHGDLPESEKAALEVLALPVWPEMTPEEIAEVAEALTATLG